MAPEPAPKELTHQESAAILQRILEVVEERQRRRWVEISCALVLAFATTASAWCAYQSTLWGGVQTFRLAAANRAGRVSAQQSLASNQFRAFDVQLLLTYLEARGRGDDTFATFLYERFRPEAKKAVDAWLKTDPFKNPNAPKRPFEMTEYDQPELREARLRGEEADRMLDAAEQANEAADRYVLLTVLFASVLFFGGIGGTFQSRRLRFVVFIIAVVLLIGTLFALGTMPVCRE